MKKLIFFKQFIYSQAKTFPLARSFHKCVSKLIFFNMCYMVFKTQIFSTALEVKLNMARDKKLFISTIKIKHPKACIRASTNNPAKAFKCDGTSCGGHATIWFPRKEELMGHLLNIHKYPCLNCSLFDADFEKIRDSPKNSPEVTEFKANVKRHFCLHHKVIPALEYGCIAFMNSLLPTIEE